MKKPKAFTVGFLVFVGVFASVLGALQLDHLLRDGKGNRVVVLGQRSEGTLTPAQSGLVSPPDFRAAAKKIIPSVVSIDSVISGEDMFSNRVVEQKAGTASGVVISAEGYVVTNNHVVNIESNMRQGLADKVVVNYSDGKSEVAKIVGTDESSDLAVLKVTRKDLTPISLGDSAKLEIGQWVMALGNPLGYSNTLSVGVVSSVGRPLPSGGTRLFVDGIQTDAAINQGNSGGALCDATGNLVGINTAIASVGGGSIGIGFAIPVNRMKQVVSDILKYGRAKYGAMGVAIWTRPGGLALPENRAVIKEYLGTTSEPPELGAMIQQVAAGSPAQVAGLKLGDVITQINGKAVKDFSDFRAAVGASRPGDKFELVVWSMGATRTVQLTLAEANQ